MGCLHGTAFDFALARDAGAVTATFNQVKHVDSRFEESIRAFPIHFRVPKWTDEEYFRVIQTALSMNGPEFLQKRLAEEDIGAPVLPK